jgi:squalene-hopene/tetraprenyl-beta-curcumene cyclase
VGRVTPWNMQVIVRFTATVPRVFFLRYHGYAKYFPLWAMACFRNLKKGNRHPVLVGM